MHARCCFCCSYNSTSLSCRKLRLPPSGEAFLCQKAPEDRTRPPPQGGLHALAIPRDILEPCGSSSAGSSQLGVAPPPPALAAGALGPCRGASSFCPLAVPTSPFSPCTGCRCRAFDWEGDEGWRAYRANIEIPPGKEALEVKVKAKASRCHALEGDPSVGCLHIELQLNPCMSRAGQAAWTQAAARQDPCRSRLGAHPELAIKHTRRCARHRCGLAGA